MGKHIKVREENFAYQISIKEQNHLQFRSYPWRQLTIRRLKMKLIFVGSLNLSDVLQFFLITDYKYELLSGPVGTET